MRTMQRGGGAGGAGGAGGGAGSAANGSAIQGRGDKKKYLKQAITAAQVSTASVGRFDKVVRGEPSKTAGKRKQYEGGVGAAATERDAQKVQRVVDQMFPTSGSKHAKILDRRKLKTGS